MSKVSEEQLDAIIDAAWSFISRNWRDLEDGDATPEELRADIVEVLESLASGNRSRKCPGADCPKHGYLHPDEMCPAEMPIIR